MESLNARIAQDNKFFHYFKNYIIYYIHPNYLIFKTEYLTMSTKKRSESKRAFSVATTQYSNYKKLNFSITKKIILYQSKIFNLSHCVDSCCMVVEKVEIF